VSFSMFFRDRFLDDFSMAFLTEFYPKYGPNLSKVMSRESIKIDTVSNLFPRGCFRRSLGSPWHPFGSVRIVLGILFGSIFVKCYIKSSRPTS
jgi:hypothetical protein